MENNIVSNEDFKKICTQILIEFKKICEKNNLTFFLGYGTALGAVRHGGFIPWDDDIDVIMPRPDYEKLIQIYNNEDERYLLLCHEIDDSYFYPFAKLCDKSTILIEKHFANDKNMGIYIDIFPLDGNGNERKSAEKHLHKCIKTQQKLNNAMAKHFFRGNNNAIKEIMRYFRYRIIKRIGSKHYYKKLDDLFKKYLLHDSLYVSNNSWGTTKELFEKDIFERSVDIEFEGNVFPIVENYDKYLSSLYGDYMKLPPKESQVSHHDIIVYYKEKDKLNGL